MLTLLSPEGALTWQKVKLAQNIQIYRRPHQIDNVEALFDLLFTFLVATGRLALAARGCELIRHDCCTPADAESFQPTVHLFEAHQICPTQLYLLIS